MENFDNFESWFKYITAMPIEDLQQYQNSLWNQYSKNIWFCSELTSGLKRIFYTKKSLSLKFKINIITLLLKNHETRYIKNIRDDNSK